jgi:phage gpG-like protein
MKVSVKAVGVENVMVKLDKIGGAVKDLSPAFEDMSGVIIQEFKANFPAAGKNLNAPWVPRKRKYPWPIFIKTGKMMKSWDSEVEQKKLTISNPTEYALFHHYGMYPQPVRLLVNSTSKILKIIKERIKKHFNQFF